AEFASLRERTCRLALAVGVEVPPGPKLESLKGLAALLGEVSEAEERRKEWSARAAVALAVLDKVLRLRHTQQAEFAPLAACQDQARALRAEIAGGPSDALDEVVNSLAGQDHPFSYLTAMVEGNEGISDDLWESLFDSVGKAFGRTPAAAVARAKI